MILDTVEIWIDREEAVTVWFRKQLLTPDGGSTTVNFDRRLSEIRTGRYRKSILKFEIGDIVSSWMRLEKPNSRDSDSFAPVP